MTWPTYPEVPGLPAAIERHNQRQIGPTSGPPPGYGAAVDVWRGGVHLWRSYGLDTAESVDDYALRQFGPDFPRNHNDGAWRAPGVEVALFPVPTERSVAPMSLQAASDMVATMLAIGQLPAPPEGVDTVPAANSLTARFIRSALPWHVFAASAGGVAVRCLLWRLGAAEKPQDGGNGLPRRWYTCRLVRRPSLKLEPVRLSEAQGRFSLPAEPQDETYLRRVLRLAKATLGCTGIPAARDTGAAGLVWRFTEEPFLLVIEEDQST